MPPTRSPYSGPEKKLVLAFDIGTTFSGISYCILNPGHVPEICGVQRFPAQQSGGDSKIPTIMYYDQFGRLRSCGAEAKQASIQGQAAAENWVEAKWFKLHMRPQSISGSRPDINWEIPKLPPGKTVIDLFADFMQYLQRCARLYIQDAYPNGIALWHSVEGKIEYVLSHPNGWEGLQQQQMRQAAVKAHLVPDTPGGHQRVRFVTEGEASLHFCIQKGLALQPVTNGGGVLIVDCGGGTIDISAYGQSSGAKFEEIAAAECSLQGSVFVTTRAHKFLNSSLGSLHQLTGTFPTDADLFIDYLRGSRFHNKIDAMITAFDESAKLTFENTATPLYIRFGRPPDFDPSVNIRAGQLCLSGTEVATFFQPSVDYIVNAIVDQRRKATRRITSIFMVGGFTANKYLFTQIKGAPGLADVNVCKPDSHVNKAVAEGAMSFYLDGYVNSRVSKFAYGVGCNVQYEMNLQSHRERQFKVYTGLDGVRRVPDAFDTILPKGKQVSETQEFRQPYIRLGSRADELSLVSSSIQVYRGSSVPEWKDVEKDQYSILCQIEADASQLCRSLSPGYYNGRAFYTINYDIIMSFGLTELKAQIAWKEHGVERRGPAKIVYDALG